MSSILSFGKVMVSECRSDGYSQDKMAIEGHQDEHDEGRRDGLESEEVSSSPWTPTQLSLLPFQVGHMLTRLANLMDLEAAVLAAMMSEIKRRRSVIAFIS